MDEKIFRKRAADMLLIAPIEALIIFIFSLVIELVFYSGKENIFIMVKHSIWRAVVYPIMLNLLKPIHYDNDSLGTEKIQKWRIFWWLWKIYERVAAFMNKYENIIFATGLIIFLCIVGSSFYFAIKGILWMTKHIVITVH